MNPDQSEAATRSATSAGSTEGTSPTPSVMATITHGHAQVGGVEIFYREAGPKDARTIVLLHGFPSSSRQFDRLIPLLAIHYHVIAPDFPGFGRSDSPSPATYSFTFDQLAQTVDALLEHLNTNRYTLYLFDYGAPIGYRIILAHPERLQALVIQNGNAYNVGLGPKWAKIADFWADPKAHPEVVDAFLSYEATKQRHLAGTSHPEAYDPHRWADEFAHLTQTGQREIQAALLYDYRTNVASYPAWQVWLRKNRPPTLVVWGANDPSFIAAGALAYRADLPDAEIHLLDAGHFALEEKNDEIAGLILDFMARIPD
jgi:pimeloyl-ACP methyl ester carboxylesterase